MSESTALRSRTLRELDDLADTVDDAISASSLKPATVDNVVELALLRSFSVGERFIRDLFYLCMTKDPSVGGNGGIVEIDDPEHVRLLLQSTFERDMPFVSWLPASRFLDAASRYLNPGNPFEWVRYRRAEITAISDVHILRNAIAHPDSEAMDKFRKLSDERGYQATRVADFLLSKRQGTLEILLYIARLKQIALAMTSETEGDASKSLDPEPPFNSGSRGPAGAYTCLRGGHDYKQLDSTGVLPPCAKCSVPSSCPECGHRPKVTSQWRRQI